MSVEMRTQTDAMLEEQVKQMIAMLVYMDARMETMNEKMYARMKKVD